MNKETIEILKKLVDLYYTPYIFESSIKDVNQDISVPLKLIFNYYKTPTYYEEGYKFFTKLNEKVTSVKYFINSFAYELFYSYQLKRFNTIERFLDSHSTEMAKNKYDEASSFCLYNFYRGLIFLSRRVNNLHILTYNNYYRNIMTPLSPSSAYFIYYQKGLRCITLCMLSHSKD